MAKAALKKGKSAKKAPAPAKKITSLKKPYTKGEMLNYMADRAGLKRANVVHVMDALAELLEAHVTNKNVGTFVLAGLAKFKVIRKPATKARKGTNPFTGEPTTFKAKPARNVVKIRPLKKLKEMVE